MHKEIQVAGKYMELDVFIPKFNLAFEYNGSQHYADSPLFKWDISAQTERDVHKKNECEKVGISLIEIPYWWDQTKESLIDIIQRHKPDLEYDLRSHLRISPK